MRNLLLYCGTDRENYNLIRPLLWERNVQAIRITAFMSGGIGAVFLLMNLILRSGVLVPYLFLLGGSAFTLGDTYVIGDAHFKKNFRVTYCFTDIYQKRYWTPSLQWNEN